MQPPVPLRNYYLTSIKRITLQKTLRDMKVYTCDSNVPTSNELAFLDGHIFLSLAEAIRSLYRGELEEAKETIKPPHSEMHLNSKLA